MTISNEQIKTLGEHGRLYAERWNSQITAWNAKVGNTMQNQINKITAAQDMALIAALTDIVRIIRGEDPMNSGQGTNSGTGADGIGGEKITTKSVKEPTDKTNKHGSPVYTTYQPIYSFRFPYLNKHRLKSSGDGIWRVITNNDKSTILGIFDYHGGGMTAWNGQGLQANTANKPREK